MRPIDADAFANVLRKDKKYMRLLMSKETTLIDVLSTVIDDLEGTGLDGYKNAPTVSAEPEWIPCSERMPEEKDAGILKKLGINKRSDTVLVTVEVKEGCITETAHTTDGIWHWKMRYAFPDYKVLAWMPKPEPYREGENE